MISTTSLSSWIPGLTVMYKGLVGHPVSAQVLHTPQRMMNTRAMYPLMLSLFLGSVFSFWLLAHAAAAFHLPHCQLINQTVTLEKEGCPRCHSVETTICSGHCLTKDPVIKMVYSNIYQNVCTYQDFHYKTFEFPDCPPDVDPIVSYPVALSCHCSRCNMKTSDCTYESVQPNFCANDRSYYY